MQLYRLVMGLLAFGIVAKLCLRGDWSTLKDRLARSTPSNHAPHIWIHAASNGELASVKPALLALLDDGHRLLITVNTQSAKFMAQGWALPKTDLRLAPLDLTGATRRMMRKWSVKAYITVESDIWPQRILNCPGPVIIIGGRLTTRTAKGWKRFPAFIQHVLNNVNYLSAQDQNSLGRFRDLGLPDASIGPVFDLKALYTPPSMPVPDDLARQFDRTTTWLAASTHEGEDQIILKAHTQARAQMPNLRLILAPRHPKRADDIARLVNRDGLTLARRSRKDPPNDADVYLADTLGEMPLWYQLAGTTFVAGSLTDRGGHTPYEPAAFGSAIIHGPDTGNFSASYQRLGDANAAICVTSASELSTAVLKLSEPETQQSMAKDAQAALHQDTDLKALMHDIVTRLDA